METLQYSGNEAREAAGKMTEPAISDRPDDGSEFRLAKGGVLVIGSTMVEFVRYEAGSAVLSVHTKGKDDGNPQSAPVCHVR